MSGSSESSEPDLTPLLDMVFQLITFFMLVVNFKTAAMDMSLKLPVVGSVQPVDNKEAEELIVFNIASDGKLNVNGERVENIDKFIAQEAHLSLQKAKVNHPELKPKDELPAQIVIRADKDTPYKLLNKIIVTCQDVGFRNFALKAMNGKGE
jgi:biopolymer transport protein ExbD